MGREREASSHPDDIAPSSEQRLLVSLICSARPLAVSGAVSNGWVWHGGYKHQTITAFIQSFISFLQAKQLHTEWEEMARSPAESMATSVGQLYCSRQGLLGQTGDCRWKALSGSCCGSLTAGSSEDCAVSARGSSPLLHSLQWRHLGSPRAGRPAERDRWLSPGEWQAPPGMVSRLCHGDQPAMLEERCRRARGLLNALWMLSLSCFAIQEGLGLQLRFFLGNFADGAVTGLRVFQP